jgi:hypothetical protein
VNVKHWRHRKLFQDLGRKGAQALNSLPRERRSEIAKKAAATRRQKRSAASPTVEESIVEAHGGRVRALASDVMPSEAAE